MECTQCGSDSSDSDSNIGLSKNPSSSGKRVLSSSEEEIVDQQGNQTQPSSARKTCPSGDCTDNRRHSLRKRCKKFRLPSRDEQWSSIPTDSKVSNKMSCLKPRKLINDFTRITNRYNYDYEEVSGEESMEEFLKATDSSESSESSKPSSTKQQSRKKQKDHRVKGYRPRLVKQSSESSGDSDLDSSKVEKGTDKRLRSNNQKAAAGKEKTDQSKTQLDKKQKRIKGNASKALSSDEDTQPVGRMKKTLRNSLLDSDEEELSKDSSNSWNQNKDDSKEQSGLIAVSDKVAEQSDEDDSQIKAVSSRKGRNRSAVLSDDSESEEKDPAKEVSSVSPDQLCNKSQEGVNDAQSSETPEKQMTKDLRDSGTRSGTPSHDSAIGDGDSGSSVSDHDDDKSKTVEVHSSGSESNEDSSEDSDDDEMERSRIEKLAAKKQQKRDMFDKLKSARVKVIKKT